MTSISLMKYNRLIHDKTKFYVPESSKPAGSILGVRKAMNKFSR